MDERARAQWIAAQVLPYEAELRSWLRRHLDGIRAVDVDDLVQEVFARIWATDCTVIRNARAYLYATVRHLLTERVRQNNVVSLDLLGEIEALSLISNEPGPDRLVGSRQELERVRRIVATLPTQCRRVFELRKFEGLSHQEISRVMGISRKTVVNHVTRALSKISEALAVYEAHDTPVRKLLGRRRTARDRRDE